MQTSFEPPGTFPSVSELIRRIKEVVGGHFPEVGVEGELSNFRRPASGHCYFTLKDAGAQVRCILWRSVAEGLFFHPRDGMLVRVRGAVDLYEARGDLQVVVRFMEPAGEGALQQAFEALKRTLAAEGLFDARHKKNLPPYPEVIGLITSGTGAALHDMQSILARRFPQVRLLVCPVPVQGAAAAEAIAGAIDAFNALPEGDAFRPEVLLVGRGGGSAEDLWAFNEEVVARAIFASEIPVVSAVGHETDFSIADFVADVRAATPSMAAELAVPDRREVTAYVLTCHSALHDLLTRTLSDHRLHLQRITGSHGFNRPVDRLHQAGQRLDDLALRLSRIPALLLASRRHRVDALQAQLHLLDPRRPLQMGYARITRDGEPVHRAAVLQEQDRLTLHFLDGERIARVEA